MEGSNHKCAAWGPLVLRVFLGLLFIVPGINKILAPDGIIGMLGNLGFPAATFFGWVLILAEIIFGAFLILGFWTRWAVWPLFIVLLVAIFTVTIPNMGGNPVTLLFHLLGLSALVSLHLTGPGKWAAGK